MRRKEREVTDTAIIDEIIANCDCCRIALNTEKAPYIVPLNFAYERVDNKSFFYFHGALTGRKIELMKAYPYAGFELDTSHNLVTHEEACGHSFLYQSVLGSGRVFLLQDKEEKKKALSFIMNHYTGKASWPINDAVLDHMAVIKLEVEEMSCKQHQ